LQKKSLSSAAGKVHVAKELNMCCNKLTQFSATAIFSQIVFNTPPTLWWVDFDEKLF
jgi:hypothetical protein